MLDLEIRFRKNSYHKRILGIDVIPIHAEEGGDLEVLFAATLLHDCVAVEKNSPLRAQASRLSAEKAAQVLKSLDWPEAKIQAVAHAVEAHSFSAGVVPTTVEARSLQDADRLDAIGMLPDCAFNLAMAEQQLDGPEVLRAFVNQGCLGTAH